MAMVLKYYFPQEIITPLKTSKEAIEEGCRTIDAGTSWDYFGKMANKYNLQFYQTGSFAEAKQWLDNRKQGLIICAMGPGNWTTEGHYIVLWNIQNQLVYINDPMSKADSRTVNSS